MKKLIVLLLVTGVMSLGFSTISFAQDEVEGDTTQTEAPAQQEVVADVVDESEEIVEEEQSFHQVVKEQFIAGGWEFMSVVLICLIRGLFLL